MGQIGRIASRCHANTLEKTCLHRYRSLLDLFLVSGLFEELPTWRDRAVGSSGEKPAAGIPANPRNQATKSKD